MQLPARRVPAAEIVRAGARERNARAGGDEEELLQHFSQPQPLHRPSQGLRGHTQERLLLCTACLPSRECWSALWEHRAPTVPGPSRVGMHCLGVGLEAALPREVWWPRTPLLPCGWGLWQDPRRKHLACSELRVHCCSTLLGASEMPGEMGDGRPGSAGDDALSPGPGTVSLLHRREERRSPAEPHSVPLTRGGCHTGLSAAAPPSALHPPFPGAAQPGASRCTREPSEPASLPLTSFPLPSKILEPSSSIS